MNKHEIKFKEPRLIQVHKDVCTQAKSLPGWNFFYTLYCLRVLLSCKLLSAVMKRISWKFLYNREKKREIVKNLSKKTLISFCESAGWWPVSSREVKFSFFITHKKMWSVVAYVKCIWSYTSCFFVFQFTKHFFFFINFMTCW